MGYKVVAASLALYCVGVSAEAETIVSCTGSSGNGYFFSGPLVPPENAGWQKDAISNGAISLSSEGNEVDILIKDVKGMMSSRAEGAEVTVIDINDPFVTVLVNYPAGAKELYTFDLQRKIVVWSQHKFGIFIDKVSAMVASCGGELD